MRKFTIAVLHTSAKCPDGLASSDTKTGASSDNLSWFFKCAVPTQQGPKSKSKSQTVTQGFYFFPRYQNPKVGTRNESISFMSSCCNEAVRWSAKAERSFVCFNSCNETGGGFSFHTFLLPGWRSFDCSGPARSTRCWGLSEATSEFLFHLSVTMFIAGHSLKSQVINLTKMKHSFPVKA